MEPRVLDERYRILRLLGAGGMGAVYEGEHLGTGRRVAIKVIGREHAWSDPVKRRFHREARSSGALVSDHIGQMLDTGTDTQTGMPFMVMELLLGEDFQQLLDRVQVVSADLALRIASQALKGLAVAHDAGLVHRDVKPANIFLSRRSGGVVLAKILDFGVAKSVADDGKLGETAGLTRTGSVLGSPYYMAPEQARGVPIDARADLWSMGVVIYHGVCGRTPFHHVTAFGELILHLCSKPAPSVQDFAPWVRPEVAAIIDRAMQIDPNLRYQSTVEMFDDIARLLPAGDALSEAMLVGVDERARSIVAPRFHPSEQTAIPVSRVVGASTDLTSGQPISNDPPPPQRWRGVVFGGAVLAAAAAGAIAVGAYGGPKDAPRSATEEARSERADGGATPAESAVVSPVSIASEGPSAALSQPPPPSVVPAISETASASSPPPPSASALPSTSETSAKPPPPKLPPPPPSLTDFGDRK